MSQRGDEILELARGPESSNTQAKEACNEGGNGEMHRQLCVQFSWARRGRRKVEGIRGGEGLVLY